MEKINDCYSFRKIMSLSKKTNEVTFHTVSSEEVVTSSVACSKDDLLFWHVFTFLLLLLSQSVWQASMSICSRQNGI